MAVFTVFAAGAYGVTCCCLLPLQVMNGAILQQVFVVEFVIQSQMCDDCHRVEAKDFWKAVVQLRQKVAVCGLMKCTERYLFSSFGYLILFYMN